MAHNRITVIFDESSCAGMPPANGYNVQYRPVGSNVAYRDGGNFTATPAVIDDLNDPAGTQYEGYLRGDCGGGVYGVHSTFTTS